MPTPRRIEHSNWSIVLATFTGPDHAAAAKDACQKLGERLPEFKSAFVRSTDRGSMVLYGQFPGPTAPEAQAELKRIQSFVYQGKRPFASAMLARPEPTRQPPTGPYDLRHVRDRAGRGSTTLFTLQVAAWADFDGTRSLAEIRRSAESYAAQLRSKGYEAWYHHDDDLKMSVVTVGVFGPDAYNPKSTLYSPEVERLFRKFPHHLVNGEPLLLRVDPRNPRSKEVAQPCLLVEVPR